MALRDDIENETDHENNQHYEWKDGRMGTKYSFTQWLNCSMPTVSFSTLTCSRDNVKMLKET